MSEAVAVTSISSCHLRAMQASLLKRWFGTSRASQLEDSDHRFCPIPSSNGTHSLRPSTSAGLGAVLLLSVRCNGRGQEVHLGTKRACTRPECHMHSLRQISKAESLRSRSLCNVQPFMEVRCIELVSLHHFTGKVAVDVGLPGQAEHPWYHRFG